jgi:hypothetical protein
MPAVIRADTAVTRANADRAAEEAERRGLDIGH